MHACVPAPPEGEGAPHSWCRVNCAAAARGSHTESWHVVVLRERTLGAESIALPLPVGVTQKAGMSLC